MQFATLPTSTPSHQSPTAHTANSQTGGAGASSSTSGESSNPGTSTASITANDFLQLLVTELQNQDPTANTDPNEYVNQLVQVNTLQQQIQMNQTLDGGPTLTGASNGVLQELVQMNQTLDGDLSSATPSAYLAKSTTPESVPSAEGTTVPVGNLSGAAASKEAPAAAAVATALAHRSQPVTGQTSAFERFAAYLKGRPN